MHVRYSRLYISKGHYAYRYYYYLLLFHVCRAFFFLNFLLFSLWKKKTEIWGYLITKNTYSSWIIYSLYFVRCTVKTKIYFLFQIILPKRQRRTPGNCDFSGPYHILWIGPLLLTPRWPTPIVLFWFVVLHADKHTNNTQLGSSIVMVSGRRYENGPNGLFIIQVLQVCALWS